MNTFAKLCLKSSDTPYEAYINASLNASVSSDPHTFDVYTYPLFTFNDGSVLAFELEYERVIAHVQAFDCKSEVMGEWNLTK